jgi:hypothetical protein
VRVFSNKQGLARMELEFGRFLPLFVVVALFYTSFCTLYSLPNGCIGGIAEENPISSAQTHLSAMSSQNVNFSILR